MDRRNKRNEATDKKSTNKIKDRGDLKKANDKHNKNITNENIQVNIQQQFPDRGDSERKATTNQKLEKMRINIVVKKPTNEESRIKNASDSTVGKERAKKKNIDKDGHDKPPDLGLRKRIRDKYTLKLKSINKIVPSNSNLNKKDEGNKVTSDGSKNADQPKINVAEETTQTTAKIDSSLSSGKSDENKDKKSERIPGRSEVNSAKRERHSARRKPMIKTITSKNGPVRIYKAVTFVDQRQKPTPLEINIPCDSMKKKKVSKYTDTSSLKIKTKPTISRISIKEKPVAVRKKNDRRRDRKSRHVPSPANSVFDNSSPPTEVARWAPSSIDRHTKPYYEAWVNTTLAAISKSSKKDKLYYEKQREIILKSFQRAFDERPTTPELFYENFADERYTGRIKITQR